MRAEPESIAIVGGAAIGPAEEIRDSLVVCQAGRIAFVGPRRDGEPPPGALILNAAGCLVLPGLIDTHVHGSRGDDVMIHGADGIRRISRDFLGYGVTAWLPSTVSASHDKLLRAAEACALAAEGASDGAEVVGIHVEGPYINPKRKGAQPPEGIRDPDLDECEELLAAARGLVRVITLAPELPGGLELVRVLTARGVVASLGHSDADYETALAAMDAGATHATHLFNAMPPIHHRQPGLAAACLNEPGIVAEVIADGVHLDPEIVRLAVRAKGPDRVALVTDAMSALGMPDGTYTLGSYAVTVRGDRCTLADGTIASSMLTMNRALRNAVGYAGVSLVDAVRMAAMVPARVAGCAERKGSLEVGKDADAVVLAPDGAVRWTIARGRLAFTTPSLPA